MSLAFLVFVKNFQEKVKNAIENMTGLHCTDVNVRIAAINMKKDRV